MHQHTPRPVGDDRAFTLVELLIVIAVMALLASLLLPAVQGARRRALEAQTTTLIRCLELAVQQYERERGGLPTLTPGQVMSDEDQQRVLYLCLNGDPEDGWGSAHAYFHFTDDVIATGDGLEPGTPPGAILDAWGRGLRFQEYRSLPPDGQTPARARRQGYSLFSLGADGVSCTSDDLGRLPP